MNIYDKRNAFSLQKKEAVLVVFRISKLQEFKNLGPWKLIENFLKKNKNKKAPNSNF